MRRCKLQRAKLQSIFVQIIILNFITMICGYYSPFTYVSSKKRKIKRSDLHLSLHLDRNIPPNRQHVAKGKQQRKFDGLCEHNQWLPRTASKRKMLPISSISNKYYNISAGFLTTIELSTFTFIRFLERSEDFMWGFHTINIKTNPASKQAANA